MHSKKYLMRVVPAVSPEYFEIPVLAGTIPCCIFDWHFGDRASDSKDWIRMWFACLHGWRT
jgi:hypothetical protein